MQIFDITLNADLCAQAHASCTQTQDRQEVHMACQYKCQSMHGKIPKLNQTEPKLQIPGHAENVSQISTNRKKNLQIKSFKTVVVSDASPTCTDVEITEHGWRQSS